MSAAVVEPPVAALPPVEYARRLGAKDRAALLAELLRESDSPLTTADRVYLSLAPEMRSALMRPYLELNLDDTLSEAEVASLTSPGDGR